MLRSSLALSVLLALASCSTVGESTLGSRWAQTQATLMWEIDRSEADIAFAMDQLRVAPPSERRKALQVRGEALGDHLTSLRNKWEQQSTPPAQSSLPQAQGSLRKLRQEASKLRTESQLL